MLVIIKSAPHTDEAQRGLSIARETSADIVLLQDGVYITRQGGLDGFKGTAYALEDDVMLRGKGSGDGGAKRIGYGELVDLMAGEEKVVGLF